MNRPSPEPPNRQMSEEQDLTEGNGAETADKQFLLQQLYLKDMSFEAPNSPDVFNADRTDADTQLNIKSSHRQVASDAYEVVLHLSVHAKSGEQTVFLIELEQAGLFQINGYSPDETRALLGTHCSAALFPYARETISSMVGKGGFPPLMLQPINFEALYAQAAQKVSPD